MYLVIKMKPHTHTVKRWCSWSGLIWSGKISQIVHITFYAFDSYIGPSRSTFLCGSESIMAEVHQQFSHHNSSGCLEWQIMWQQSERHASAFHNNKAAQLQVLIAVCVGRQKSTRWWSAAVSRGSSRRMKVSRDVICDCAPAGCLGRFKIEEPLIQDERWKSWVQPHTVGCRWWLWELDDRTW